jgi:hypothetical protein
LQHTRSAGFNLPGRNNFTFLDTCYQIPVAVWPYDPFKKLPDGDERSKYCDIIDRNQDEDI